MALSTWQARQSVGNRWRLADRRTPGRMLVGWIGWLTGRTAQLGNKSWLARYMLWPTQAIIMPWTAKNGRVKRINISVTLMIMLSHLLLYLIARLV